MDSAINPLSCPNVDLISAIQSLITQDLRGTCRNKKCLLTLLTVQYGSTEFVGTPRTLADLMYYL